MFIDYDNPTLTAGVITFPDHTFPNQPLPPSQIKETVTIKGTNTSSTSVRGESDRRES